MPGFINKENNIHKGLTVLVAPLAKDTNGNLVADSLNINQPFTITEHESAWGRSGSIKVTIANAHGDTREVSSDSLRLLKK